MHYKYGNIFRNKNDHKHYLYSNRFNDLNVLIPIEESLAGRFVHVEDDILEKDYEYICETIRQFVYEEPKLPVIRVGNVVTSGNGYRLICVTLKHPVKFYAIDLCGNQRMDKLHDSIEEMVEACGYFFESESLEEFYANK